MLLIVLVKTSKLLKLVIINTIMIMLIKMIGKKYLLKLNVSLEASKET